MDWIGDSVAKRNGRLSRLWVAFCCLLSFMASFDLPVLAQVLDPAPAPWLPLAVAEVEDPLEDEGAMLRPTTAVERRGERKQPSSGFPVTARPDTPACSVVPEPFHTLSCLKRAGCEHALRNGLGAPLLC
jgi:hypothetical protein